MVVSRAAVVGDSPGSQRHLLCEVKAKQEAVADKLKRFERAGLAQGCAKLDQMDIEDKERGTAK